MSVRVMITDNQYYAESKNEIWVEDNQDTNSEFGYQDFLGFLHKRIRAKTVETS